MTASGRQGSAISTGLSRLFWGTGLLGPVVLALSAAVLALAPGLGAVGAVGASALGTLVLATHFGASLLRAWRAARWTLALVPVGVVAAPILVLHPSAGPLEAAWTIANVLLPLHVALQLHRVTTVFTHAGNRRAHVQLAASLLVAAAGLVAVLAGPRDPLMLRGFLSVATAMPIVAVLASAAVVAAVVVAVSARSVAVAVAFVIVAAGWCAPLALGDAIEPHATLVNALAIAHGAQLVWLALFVEARAPGRAKFDPLAHVGLAVVVGALLLVDVPWVASRVAGIDVVTALLATQATLAIAHVIVDAFAFRMGAIDRGAPAAPSSRADVSTVRALAFAVPGFLVALGLVVDAWQTWLVRAAASDDDLLRAELFHPYDARVLLPQVVRSLAHDDKDRARAVLGELAHAHAFSPAAARSRFLLCVLEMDGGRAAPDCGDVPGYLDDDVEVLAMGARMALQHGHADVAKRKARRAVELAPDDPGALAALGMAEVHIGEAQPAIDHLERALALRQAHAGDVDPLAHGDPQFLDVGLALARAYGMRSDARTAAVTQRVVAGATKADKPRLAMIALALEARAHDDGGDARVALQAYQRALQVAPFANAPADEAEVWLDYASLLERSQASEDAIYACVLKASALVERVPASQGHPARARLVERATAARTNAELVTSEEARLRVRADVDGAALQALTLQYAPK